MPIDSIRRRVGKLESEGPFRRVCQYPAFAAREIDAIAHRMGSDEPLTYEELERIEQHSPLLHGEYIICANRGHVTAKRYIGIDVAEI